MPERCIVSGYVPPPHKPGADTFYSNLTQFRTTYPLRLYSDHEPYGLRKIGNPSPYRNQKKPFVISNLIFLSALADAIDAGLDYMLYIEDDCRVIGDGWDGEMFNDFFRTPDAIFGGSPCCYHPMSAGRHPMKCLIEFAWSYYKWTGLPMPIFGYQSGFCFFPNGALAIYHIPTIVPHFGDFRKNPGQWALTHEAWDMHIGRSLFEQYGVSLLERFAAVPCAYSGYGNQVFQEHERKVMLTSGRYRAVHQIKDAKWMPQIVTSKELKAAAQIAIQPSANPAVPPIPDAPVTVVITSFQRPEQLKLAFASCVAAQIRNVIVTATGNLALMDAVFEELLVAKPDVLILRHGSGITANQSWFLGVESATTEYVALLHDDDLLLPDYLELVTPGLSAKAPFIVVHAMNHGCPNYTIKESDKDGWESSSVLRSVLEEKGKLSISPGKGIFRRTDLAAWLRECEELPAASRLRPGFLVGNDLVLWLKAVDRYPEFFNVPRPAVSFGHWNESTTVVELGKNTSAFSGLYDDARRWHKAKSSGNISTLHIVTIVLDGMPFITQHLAAFNRLKTPWEWHIVEGAASNMHCTKWCKPQAARLSKDGTTEYLDQIGSNRVHIYRKPLWDGKVEMVNAPLPAILNECILLEVDCDEFWTADQIDAMVKMFDTDKTKTHAMFWCRYFFGPHLVMTSRNCYANAPSQDWKRAWRFRPGDKFLRHEPPHLSSEASPFMHAETEAAGLVFDHYGYVQRSQVEFKESFYGYKDAVKHWEKLQQVRTGEVKLSDYLPWVRPEQSGTVTAMQ